MDAAEAAQMSRQHIFVVNGSPDFLDMVRELLQGEHYNVTTTNFVPNTFDQIAALDPDLLIIDLVVGLRAGPELVAHLAGEAATREIPVILVSTNWHLLDEAEGIAPVGSEYRYLVKPFDIGDLLQTIDELIGPA